MVESGKTQILESELIDRPNWDSGIDDLFKSGTAPEGTFFYTWFKGVGIKK